MINIMTCLTFCWNPQCVKSAIAWLLCMTIQGCTLFFALARNGTPSQNPNDACTGRGGGGYCEEAVTRLVTGWNSIYVHSATSEQYTLTIH